MHRIEAEGVHQTGGIIGHIGHGVRRFDGPAAQEREEGLDRITHRALVEPRAEADVPVVESDHPVAPVGQLPTEVLRPHRHLGTQPHDEQDRRIGGIAELLVLQCQPIGLCLRHVAFLRSPGGG